MFCAYNETFFFFGLVYVVLREISKWIENFFFVLDKFVLKTLFSNRVFYFVGILHGVKDIFLLDCPQVLSLLNVRFKGISKPHKSPV